jgi:hypothetical protein
VNDMSFSNSPQMLIQVVNSHNCVVSYRFVAPDVGSYGGFDGVVMQQKISAAVIELINELGFLSDGDKIQFSEVY